MKKLFLKKNLGNKYRMSKTFSIIVGCGKKTRCIGVNGGLPWKISEDMKYFKNVTTQKYLGLNNNVVIMGRKTWESLPKSFRPLPDRTNIVITKSPMNYYPYGSSSLNNALNSIVNTKKFVIGGEQLYREALGHPDLDEIYVTEIDEDVHCNDDIKFDAFFPNIPGHFKLASSTPGETSGVTFQVWKSYADSDSQEKQYLDLLRDTLNNGEKRGDRTGTGTTSVFGRQLRFDLNPNISASGDIEITLPLLTTKKVYFKGVIEELLFFLRGDHDNRKLQSVGVHIWDGNTSREYLDKYNKQHIETNDLGVAYGVQWRAAGAKLENIDTDYRGKGVDQIQECIDLIKNDPTSRRIMLNAWNPVDRDDMALVPCHYSYQFYVDSNKRLSCMMTQRSSDLFLGCPFNIASTSVLTLLMAKVTGTIPHQIIINLGDAHIYDNHVQQVIEQLDRKPCYFPKLRVIKTLNTIMDIEKLCYNDFNLIDYHSHPKLSAKMAV